MRFSKQECREFASNGYVFAWYAPEDNSYHFQKRSPDGDGWFHIRLLESDLTMDNAKFMMEHDLTNTNKS